MSPKYGILISGNLEGKNIESTLNRIAGDKGDYSEEEQIDLYMYLGLEFDKDNILYVSPRNRVRLSYNINSFVDLISYYRLSANIGSSMITQGDNFKFSFGYNYVYQYTITESNTIKYIANIEDEGRIKLQVRAGGFQYDLKLFLNGSFANGDYSFIIGGLPKGKELSQIDLKVIPGIEVTAKSNKINRSLSVGIIPMEWELSRLEVGVKTVYGYESSTRYYNRVLGIVKINLFENSNLFWLSPYIGINFGLENIHEYDSETSDISESEAVLETEIGFNFLFPQFIVKDNVQYGFNCSYIMPDKVNFSLLIAIEL